MDEDNGKPKYFEISDNIKISIISFDGTEESRKTGMANMIDWVDLNEKGELKRTDISFLETKFVEELPENFKQGLREHFGKEVEEDKWFLFRFFQRNLNGEFEPVYFQDEEQIKEQVVGENKDV